uniref:Uncharacterized protein n=1 Tax=Eucampia antarctica TaxID=49252 RepID=A0A7S2WPZ2_9STRA|mmetsp:Transcript_7911/g.7509  ORF Transcript_7911/g.7509 Transcript_7911/m.7509 type:complete len:102 (+) Transcript_7911:390-695(+)
MSLKPMSTKQQKGIDFETRMMYDLKRKQIDEESTSRENDSKFRQAEIDSIIKIQSAQAEKATTEAKTVRISTKVILMRERAKLVEEGFIQEEINELLPTDF